MMILFTNVINHFSYKIINLKVSKFLVNLCVNIHSEINQKKLYIFFCYYFSVWLYTSAQAPNTTCIIFRQAYIIFVSCISVCITYLPPQLLDIKPGVYLRGLLKYVNCTTPLIILN